MSRCAQIPPGRERSQGFWIMPWKMLHSGWSELWHLEVKPFWAPHRPEKFHLLYKAKCDSWLHTPFYSLQADQMLSGFMPLASAVDINPKSANRWSLSCASDTCSEGTRPELWPNELSQKALTVSGVTTQEAPRSQMQKALDNHSDRKNLQSKLPNPKNGILWVCG